MTNKTNNKKATVVVDIQPADSRCMCFAARADFSNFSVCPSAVRKTTDLGTALYNKGSYEISETEAIVIHEANHRFKLRGFTTTVIFCVGGKILSVDVDTGEQSKNVQNWMRKNDFKSLSVGAGNLGAAARLLHLASLVGPEKAVEILLLGYNFCSLPFGKNGPEKAV